MNIRWLHLGYAGMCCGLAATVFLGAGCDQAKSGSPAPFEKVANAIAAKTDLPAANQPALRPNLPDDWPQFRGPHRDDISKEKGLLTAWPKDGPKLLWKTDKAGLGFSGFSIAGDFVYTMGARGDDEYAIAFNAKDGTELWSVKLGPIFTFKNNTWGDGPRATPTIDGDHVYCLAAFGELVCLKRIKGEVVWRKNLIKDFKGQIMVFSDALTGPTGWGYCESPLIDGDKLICCPGGPDGWMIALDKKNGDLKWSTKDLTDQATDSSIMVAEIGGVRQYVNSTFKGAKGGGGVAGVDPNSGKVLWYFANAKYNNYAICPTPIVKDDLVYVTAGYAIGCNLLQITKDDAGKFAAKDLYASNNKARIAMVNEHGGVILINNNIFGYCDGRGWTCQDLLKGTSVWVQRDALDGKGSLVFADGHFYLLSDQGEAVLLKLSTKGWDEKGRFALPALSPSRQNRPTHSQIGVWTHPVIANGHLYLRDQELVYCYAVK